MRALPLLLLVSLALGSSACSTFKPRYESFAGRYIDHVEPRVIEAPGDPSDGTPLSLALTGRPLASLEGSLESAPIADPALEKYVQGVLDRVLAEYPHPQPEMRLVIDSNRMFHARASADGEIFISLGLLRDLQSEDELAFALAHEASHHLIGHFERDATMRAQQRAVDFATGLAVLAFVVAASDVVQTGSNVSIVVTQRDELTTNVLLAGGIYVALREITGTIFNSAWSRRQEDEADLLALDLMMKAGYNSGAALEVLSRMESVEEEKAKLKKEQEKRFSTAYGDMLKAAAATGRLETVSQTVGVVFADGVVRAVSSARDAVGQAHSGSEKRDLDLRGYYRREYQLGEVRPERQTARYQQAVWGGATGDRLRRHLQAHEALAALDADDLPRAEKLGRQAISGRGSDAAMPRYAMYRVRSAQGRTAEATQNLQAIERSRAASSMMLQLVALEYLRMQQPDRALQAAERAAAEASIEDPFLPTLVAAGRAAGKPERVAEPYQRCLESRYQGVADACRAAAKDGAAEENAGQA